MTHAMLTVVLITIGIPYTLCSLFILCTEWYLGYKKLFVLSGILSLIVIYATNHLTIKLHPWMTTIGFILIALRITFTFVVMGFMLYISGKERMDTEGDE